MPKYCATFILLLLLCSSFILSCRKEPNFDEKPQIEFRRVEENIFVDENRIKHHDIGLVIYFQDGDGNLGLSTTLSADKQPPFNEGSPYEHNFIVNLLDRQLQPDGSYAFVPFQLPEGKLTFSGRFPRISSDDRAEPLEGEIKYNIKSLITSDIEGLAGRVVKFEVFIYDRALNQSNIVTSREVTLLP